MILNKPWKTSYIKTQMKSRQRASCRGDKMSYDRIRESILISKAKANYYRSKAENLRTSNAIKWYKSIYALVGAKNGTNPPQSLSNDNVSELPEKLQTAFIWADVLTNIVLHVTQISRLLKNTAPPLPSIGQVRTTLMYLKTKEGN